MKTSDVIKNRRLELGLKQKDVADAIGVTKATISRWESGDIKSMRRDNIEKLSRILDVPPSILLDWESYDEDRIRRNQLIRELSTVASVAKAEHIEIALDLLKKLEGKE